MEKLPVILICRHDYQHQIKQEATVMLHICFVFELCRFFWYNFRQEWQVVFSFTCPDTLYFFLVSGNKKQNSCLEISFCEQKHRGLFLVYYYGNHELGKVS